MKLIQHKQRTWHRLVFWVITLALAELGWLGLLWPLVPSTRVAWLVTLLMPLPIAGYVYLAVNGINWLSLRSSTSLLTRGLAVVLAASVGVLIFLMLYLVEHWLGGQFHYRYLSQH
jgi:hypothetical protein